jgi:hypothetical protein
VKAFHARSSGVAAVMAGAGFAVALTSAHRFEPSWQVWTTLAVSLCGASGLVGAYGLLSWRQLAAQFRPPLRRTVLPTVLAGAAAVLVIVTGEVFAPHPGSGWRGDVLVLLALSGGALAGATMLAIRSVAKRLPVSADIAAAETAIVRLVALRRSLHRLASALGLLVTLSTLALGAGIAMNPVQPREMVIVFGGGGAAGIAVFYAPAASAIRATAERLLDAVFEGHAPTDVTGLVERVEQRAKLEQLIGVDRTMFGDLQAAIPVLGPLVAAAAVFLPR